jgi:nucleotide-binding universal stress UspA family protein
MHATENTFVAAIDFWEPSLNALEMAIRFAQQFDGHIIAVHVIEKRAHYPDMMLVDEDTIEEDLQKALDALLQPYLAKGIKIETELRDGNVSRQLTEAMHQHHADALCIGLRQGRILEDIFIGTHTLNLIKAAEVPIIVVDGLPHDEHINQLLIPFDRKFGLEGTLEFLRDIGTPLGERVKILTAMLPTEQEADVMAEANRAADQLEALGVTDIEIELVQDSDIYAAIMTQIRNAAGSYDLVLLEQQDHTSRGELTLGSLIEDVVTKGRMPVLCAPRASKR